MRWTIGKRLFAVLTVTFLVVVGLNAVAHRWSFQRGFVDYLAEQEAERLQVVVARLAQIYGRDNSWTTLRRNPRTWSGVFDDGSAGPPKRPPQGDPRPGDPPRGEPPPGRPPPGGTLAADPLDLRSRAALVDANDKLVFGPDIRDERVRRADIFVDERKVGTLLVKPLSQLTEAIDLNFAEAQSRSILYVSLIVLAFAALIAALVARQMQRPIARLASGTRSLIDGEFNQHITVARDDELGDLAHDFNVLARTLDANRRQRRQWVSDVSHELRTPLAILSGELQAIEDGVRTFDQGTRVSLQSEVARLQQLVSDLHELTLSDEGGLKGSDETINVVSLLRDTLASSVDRLQRNGLSLRVEAIDTELVVTGDSRRLEQLFTNLVENTLRYTDAPGTLEVTISEFGKHVRIVFSDSEPGVPDSSLERLFDRLYRVDASRNRSTGGSGLGLSICESIVRSMGGSIEARKSHLGGVAIQVLLPLDSAPEAKP